MDQQAKSIAQALLNSGQLVDKASFSVESDGKQTDEIVMILAIKTNRLGEETLRKLADTFAIKSVAGPKGIVCPICNGTGRVG